jgi:hypothetical protein
MPRKGEEFIVTWAPGYVLPVALLCAFGITGTQESASESPPLAGPYFGQKPPGMVPEVFAPEILSKSQPEWTFCAEFSPDHKEFYFSSVDLEKEIDQIMWMKRVNDTWTRPEAAPFNTAHNTNDSRISPGGSRLFFRSRRPLPGSDGPEAGHYAWVVTREEAGWSAPQPVKCGGVPLRTGHLGVANDGTLYFAFRSEGNVGEADIHRSRFANGSYTAPENLGPSVNTKYLEGDTFIAPDESYMIVSVWNRPENKGDSDLYISFRRDDGSWTALENLGEPINTKKNENCAALSPDGKYFFYVGVDVGGEVAKVSTFWVDARILERYRPSEKR